MRNCVLKTRNFVSQTRNCAFKTMNYAGEYFGTDLQTSLRYCRGGNQMLLRFRLKNREIFEKKIQNLGEI